MKKLFFFYVMSSMWLSLAAQRGASNRSPVIVADTIFVYDTVYVTDTIHMDQSVVTPLPLTGYGQKYLVISDGFAATIIPSSIITSVPFSQIQYTEVMKKTGFIGVLLFALQHLAPAQGTFSFHTGLSGYNHRANANLRSQSAAAFHIGAGYRHTLRNSPLSFNTQLSYYFMLPAAFPPADPLSCYTPTFYQEEYQTHVHQFAIPVGIQWQAKWFAVSAGVEYSYQLTGKLENVVSDANGIPQIFSYRIPQHSGSWYAGLQSALTARSQLRLTCYRGFTSNYLWQTGGGGAYVKTNRLEGSVHYYLR